MVSYGVYINKDYKTIACNAMARQSRKGYANLFLLLLVVMGISGYLAGKYFPGSPPDLHNNTQSQVYTPVQNNQTVTRHPARVNDISISGIESSVISDNNTLQKTDIPGNQLQETVKTEEDPWQAVIVKKGDNLSNIFKRLKISPRTLYEIISINETTKRLKHIKPGEEILFKFNEDDGFVALKYDLSLTDTLEITRTDGVYKADISRTELLTEIREVHGVIDSSLFIAAQNAGLSDNLTMQLIELYGWDIDFALDIRKGDEFYLIYEERYKNGDKVKDGPILAAHFVNQGKHIKAVRYIHDDGHSDYYSETGHNMRKAFLRTPVNFTRISSRFNLRRKHPVLNKIRAHRGVDYAAPRGTVVKATGDGVVTLAANKGGYGRTVILKHGEKYSTLYAHLSKYARGIKRGIRVKQGQTIGYVGMTGLATGPHLHYEFRINDIHHNPLTVKLPKALKIPASMMDDFIQQTKPLFAQLDNLSNKDIQIAKIQKPDKAVVALNDESEENSVSTQ